ncbi:unnamed protein product [Angiostrongylus costaricensis]|uniref:Uncharacterized protein n=1 Tax=Angiostrongylus costaricensis TaxID=334426 RepID=A0A0R3PS55_ANGCS|nr:unnamed protein product [Angiostrongylus costaricensis]
MKQNKCFVQNNMDVAMESGPFMSSKSLTTGLK